VRLALQKVLVSPEFLFRMEFDPPGAPNGSVQRISDIELASRLSFFLWSTIPDEELITLAERGNLSEHRCSKPRSGACWPINARKRW